MRHLTSFILALMVMTFASLAQAAEPRRIVALGDSLTAGYGLESGTSFTTLLAEALNEKDENVVVDNAGVSGDTTAGGLSRLEWAIAGDTKPSLVIVALGANDMLRGLDPKLTRDNLKSILQTLKDQDIPTLLVGMRTPLNMGPLYSDRYEKIYTDLADEFDIPLYPFFLDGVALDANLNQSDGLHPNLEGVKIMVKRILPTVRKALN